MDIIQSASIYKLEKKNKYLVHGLSRLQMGASIASEPFIWLDGTATLNELIKQLFYALSQTKMGLANPTDWKESAKEFLDNIGLKKKSDLYKESIHVDVYKKDGVIYFTPMKNLGSKGFVNVSKEKIEVSEKSGIDEIAKALEEAFNKCE